MNLTAKQKSILRKRKFRRFVKFMFGLVFRSITYYLVFGRHKDENMVSTGGVWYPTDEEKKLVAKIKANKKDIKLKKAIEKEKVKNAKKEVIA